MKLVSINDIDTLDQNGLERSIFDPDGNALLFRMALDIDPSVFDGRYQEVLALLYFQILGYGTDTVIRQEMHPVLNPKWSSFWMSLGSDGPGQVNWTTPKKWGLVTSTYKAQGYFFGFRAMVSVFGKRPGQGDFGFVPDGFDISPVKPFMVGINWRVLR